MRKPICRDDESDDGSDIGIDGENYNIDIIGNDIHFTGEISDESMHDLIIQVKTLERKLLSVREYKPKIVLYVRSDGGDFLPD